MIGILALAAVVAADTGDSWMGRDKIRHFFMSAFVHSVAFSATRMVADRSTSRWVAGGAVVAAGVLKERSDRRAGGPFSRKDLVWNAAGGLASAALMNGAR